LGEEEIVALMEGKGGTEFYSPTKVLPWKKGGFLVLRREKRKTVLQEGGG